jgi:integrase/recombinase XerD
VQSYVLAHTDLKGQSPLLARPNGRPLHRRTVERLTSVWGQRVDVPQCLPHRFRHTFATALLEAGVDIRLIKDALGHRDIGSTMVYTRVSDEALHRSVQRLPWSLE